MLLAFDMMWLWWWKAEKLKTFQILSFLKNSNVIKKSFFVSQNAKMVAEMKETCCLEVILIQRKLQNLGKNIRNLCHMESRLNDFFDTFQWMNENFYFRRHFFWSFRSFRRNMKKWGMKWNLETLTLFLREAPAFRVV